MRRRHKARRWALQILYGWEMRARERPLREDAREFFERRRISSQTRDHAERLIDVLAENLEEIDATIAGGTENWDIDRLSVIDRDVLRIALAELLYIDDVPWKVAIDEAVTLATRYGGADSPGFVNGVLDALAHKLNLIAS
ncbi:MAG TPA: transcription antitermination factor NusB [Gemmatimonadota bacterium]|nr:transcription antitermination factor NusB [Gemmatimonadota bacterium]